VALALLLPPASPAQETDEDLLRATARVRVRLEADPDAGPGETASGAAGVVNGTGFFVSASGYLLTDAALLPAGDSGLVVAAMDVVVSPPPDEVDSRTLEAQLVAVSEELGLALLEVDAEEDLAYLRLGDSEALTEGQRLTVRGRREDPGDEDDASGDTDASDELEPFEEPGEAEEAEDPTLTTGSFVFRPERDEAASAAGWIPLRGNLESGSEGGAAVDAEGYVLAVARRAGERSEVIGVPINAVKEFLLQHGPASEFPRQLVLGPVEALPGKGLRLQLAEVLPDTWPGRTRFESPFEPDDVSLRIDRLASSLELGNLESHLLSGGLDSIPAVRAADGSNDARPARRTQTRVQGSARGERGGRRQAVEYVVMRVGNERIVARYELPEELAAYNRSVLRQSLESLQVTRFLMLSLSKPLEVEPEAANLDVQGALPVAMPHGWLREPVFPDPPEELPAAEGLLAGSPVNDYTVSFVVYYWNYHAAPLDAARQGSPREVQVRRHGVSYWSRRSFFPATEGLVLLECRVPVTKTEFVREACLVWESGVIGALAGAGAPAD
jgi:hypothetical protein